MGLETVDGAVIEVPGHDSVADPVLVHDQVEGEVFHKEFGLVTQRLLIEGVEDGMAGAVGRRAGALCRALAETGGHAAKGALVNLALGGA